MTVRGEGNHDPAAVLADLLVCPVTGVPLTVAPPAQAAKLLKLAQIADLPPGAGEPVFIDRDGRHAYLSIDGIPLLLLEAAIPLGEDPRQVEAAPVDRPRRTVIGFYDEVGWQPLGEGVFHDTVFFEDLRAVARSYCIRFRRRLLRHLPKAGDLLLDCASGPVQFDDYLDYSRGFARHVCVDRSLAALQGARRRLGGRGLFVLADVANLPFKAQSFDAVISLNTLFHLPAGEQERAIDELLRVARPGTPALIVYSWGRHAPLTRLLDGILRLAKGGERPSVAALRRLGRDVYFHAHGRAWFRARRRKWRVSYSPWKSINADHSRLLLPDNAAGAAFLRALAWLEDRLPALFVRLGEQPIIIVRRCAP